MKKTNNISLSRKPLHIVFAVLICALALIIIGVMALSVRSSGICDPSAGSAARGNAPVARGQNYPSDEVGPMDTAGLEGVNDYARP